MSSAAMAEQLILKRAPIGPNLEESMNADQTLNWRKEALAIAIMLMLGIVVARAGEGEWFCGDPNVVAVRHSVEKESTKDWWEIFAVQVGETAGPHRIVLRFNTKTRKLTLNGKRCVKRPNEKE